MGAEATVSKLSFNYHKYPLWVSNFSGSDKVFALNIKFPLKICKYSGELMPEQKFPPLLAKFTYLSNFSFLHFLWRTYNVFFILIILLILKVKILALLYEHGSENIWIRVRIFFFTYLPSIECSANFWSIMLQQHLKVQVPGGTFEHRLECKRLFETARLQTSPSPFLKNLTLKCFQFDILCLSSIFGEGKLFLG